MGKLKLSLLGSVFDWYSIAVQIQETFFDFFDWLKVIKYVSIGVISLEKHVLIFSDHKI